ncbi:MAG: hypothetical protein ACKOFW_17545 [Planctomycetaceae bacterium]
MTLPLAPAQTDVPLPAADKLPSQSALPDPLVALDGTRIATPQQWQTRRRPELLRLFQHYMYGAPPAGPVTVRATVTHTDPQLFNGKATLRLVTLKYGPEATPPLHLLLVIPNKVTTKPGVFVGLNFCGNHTVLDHPAIPLPTTWLYGHCPGCQENRATDAGRGKEAAVCRSSRPLGGVTPSPRRTRATSTPTSPTSPMGCTRTS